MANPAFIFDQDRPLIIESEVSGDIVVTMSIFVQDVWSPYEPISGVSSRQLQPPLPDDIKILYEIAGAPNIKFQVRTRFIQEDRNIVKVSEGAVEFDGTIQVLLRLRGTDLDLLDQHFVPAGSRMPSASAGVERAGGGSNFYDVWFGTNRKPLSSSSGFSAERDSVTHFGRCRVNIPRSHKIGSLGSAWWKRMLRGDDRLRVGSMKKLDESAYWSGVAARLAHAAAAERDAVIFLHGYNTSFENAALRAAQLGFDLGISGLMAFYSWPSKGTLDGYMADEASIEASEGFITEYLTSMATKSDALKVHIIAHSMGNRALLRVMDRIAATAAERAQKPFNQLILAAPDVDQDTFTRLSVAYRDVAERTTLYVCSQDKAVEASHWLHDFPRAGLTPPVMVVPGIDTITVSNLDLTGLAHGYVAEARDVLQDIYRLLREGSPPEKRFGLRREVTSEGGQYWAVGR
jgi:esterase/lipase superfamily enzyme